MCIPDGKGGYVTGPIPGGNPRAPYFLCRYVRTDEVKPSVGFTVGRDAFNRPTSALAYVYRLKRVSDAIYLTAHEAETITNAFQEEGNPELLPADKAIEGKAL